VDLHNLEAYLHMVAGTHGIGKPFSLEIARDLALVNKSRNLLRDEYLVPDAWWQQLPHKGMVRSSINGSWHVPDREEHRKPKPEPLHELLEEDLVPFDKNQSNPKP
jgi:hypothetical protein